MKRSNLNVVLKNQIKIPVEVFWSLQESEGQMTGTPHA